MESGTTSTTLDRVASERRIQLHRQNEPFSGGTIVKITWPDLAGYLDQYDGYDFYKDIVNLRQLIAACAAFNPHVRVHFE